jgi:hypothetical protein
MVNTLRQEEVVVNTRLLITGDYNIKNGSLTTLFNMTTTGLSTFSGGVTINQSASEIQHTINSNATTKPSITQYRVNNSSGWEVGMANAANSYSYLFSYGDFGPANSKFTLTSAGAATFASSVNASTFLSSGWFAAPNNYGLTATNAAGTAGRVLIKLNASNQIEIGRDTDISQIRIGTAATTDAFTITSAGNSGFGLTNPQSQVHLNGTITLTESGFDTVRKHTITHSHSDGSSTNNYVAINVSDGSGTTAERIRVNGSGHVLPGANGTQDLGSTSLRWGTVYTSDLSLNNGIGDWTIVEGEDDLFLYNNKKGKVYKFALTEVDPNVATPKKS